MSTESKPQPTYTVTPHPKGTELLGARLKCALNVPMENRDLNSGDELTITVHTKHGELIAQAIAEVQDPSFPPVRYDGTVVGTERVHRAKVMR